MRPILVTVMQAPKDPFCTHLMVTVQWSDDVIKADPFFGRSRVQFRVPPWV